MLAAAPAAPQEGSPRYQADVPPSITTPDRLDTKLLGRLEFTDGMPSAETARKTQDFMVVARGTEAFLSGMPATSLYAFTAGLRAAGLDPGDLGLTESLLDAKSLLLTPNTTTLYAFTEIDVSGGPQVLVIPPGTLGPMQDAMFRHISDVGFTGPDEGRGGRYLVVRDDWKGEIPRGYFVARTPANRNLLIFRVFVEGGDLAGAASAARGAFRAYPLSRADDPPPQKSFNLSGKRFNTIHANDFRFFEELNQVVQHEPASFFGPQLAGTFAAIGIRKGHAFAPDARMKTLLNEAIGIGNAAARSVSFASLDRHLYFWPDRQWFGYAGAHDFIDNGAMMLDDRVAWHYIATGVTPAMTRPAVGTGSVYAASARDAAGQYLEGGKTYSVTLPGPVPARTFWSFTVYGNQHRSLLETDQRTAGVDSNAKNLRPNPDGSYTIWFGPKPPPGKVGNWVQTWPGHGWFTILRLFGPLEPWFDKSWKPGDLQVETGAEGANP
jgi:hypothetical protein